ncbi:flavin reductase family protein [Sphingomonas sp. AOB5]|uniref:flavin reductase family protein n=1 Tax=Sphingomonas sp. AOB5 TaxID=3034017 RepID=UPI0023F987DF|nr:flavin reductase family protein [Sphingomonas sp. AOB5]MDF7775591.1 flavin reductase family protein [Sphingomonas sp. AOB5]
MRFDVAELDAVKCARLVTATVVPRPIAWVVTQAPDGTRNAAPFSFFNAMSSWPPVLAIGMQPRADGSPKDTLANIRATGEFVVNLVPHALADAMNLTGGAHAPAVDEIRLAGLDSVPSEHIVPPRIVGAPVAYECRLRQVVDIEAGRAIVLGDVLAMHIDDAAILDADAGKIDAPALDLVARMHGAEHYLRTSDLFRIARL